MKAYDGSKPTVGRIVHYHIEDSTEPYAALITAVNPDDTVELNVFAKRGSPLKNGQFGEGIIASFSEEPKPGHWTWPPRV